MHNKLKPSSGERISANVFQLVPIRRARICDTHTVEP